MSNRSSSRSGLVARKSLSIPFLLASALSLGLPAAALAREFEAGPIWNQPDAQNKCPRVCKAPWTWNGHWWTTVPNKMSVCSCVQKVARNAGPIWNQPDAQSKCPNVCASPAKWNGQWWTTVPGTMSVCECLVP